MKKPVLIIMAAGMGSRFGGLKQITPVDDAGHIIMDFSIFDAKRAGFEKVVIVIKKENEESFRSAIGDKISRFIEVEYAYQSLEDLPAGFAVPEGRQKPWGTGHATLSAAPFVDGPFAVINADDFYGRTAYESLYAFLAGGHGSNEHAMVGYLIKNTLTENGSVARGICSVSGDGYLETITERTKIIKVPDGAAYTEDDGKTYTQVSGDTIVSLNFWGFGEGMMAELQNRFAAFLQENLPKNPLKCEYFLPTVADIQIKEKLGTVKVLPTHETWYGVTYREDLESVTAAIARMKKDGVYPERLWN